MALLTITRVKYKIKNIERVKLNLSDKLCDIESAMKSGEKESQEYIDTYASYIEKDKKLIRLNQILFVMTKMELTAIEVRENGAN
jgi:endonuclease III